MSKTSLGRAVFLSFSFAEQLQYYGKDLWVLNSNLGKVTLSFDKLNNTYWFLSIHGVYMCVFINSDMGPYVWSSCGCRMPLQIWGQALFYLMCLLYHYHQLFIDIERENERIYLVSIERVSFKELLAMINLY